MQGNGTTKETEGQGKEVKFYSAATPVIQHEAILHMLNRNMPNDDGTPGKHYPAEAFTDSVKLWEGIPIVFSPTGKHPDLDAFTNDQATALKELGARIVGTVGETWIDTHGRPKLMGILNIHDVLVEKLFNEGKLSLSTGFHGMGLNNTLVGVTRPNHLLLFEESPATGVVPRDLGSQILNNKARPCQVKNGGIMPDQTTAAAPEATKGLAPGVLDRFKTLLQEALGILEGDKPKDETPVTASVPPKVTTLTNSKEDESMDAELKAQVDTLTAEMSALKATNATLLAERDQFKLKVDAIEAAQKEEKWNNVKQHLEVGRVDTPEKVAAERAALDKDPVAYMLTVVNTKKVDTKGAEGIAENNSVDKASEAYMNAKKAVDAQMRRPKQGRSK